MTLFKNAKGEKQESRIIVVLGNVYNRKNTRSRRLIPPVINTFAEINVVKLHLQTELVQTNEINPRDYFNLFPSVFLGYEINEKNTFQVSYSRRIRRPGFWELNPFLTFSDARHIWGGNHEVYH